MRMPSECARAATAKEARFRVDYPNSRPRSSKIVALDDGAATAIRAIRDTPWRGARFLSVIGRTTGAHGLDSIPPDLDLRESSGKTVRLADELPGADLVVMIATDGAAADAASIVGRACEARGIMTTGVILRADGRPEADGRTLGALRPHARMLVVVSDAEFIPDMLTALRA